MKKVKVLVLRTAGTNCDKETAYAFGLAGAETDILHINKVCESGFSVSDYSILALPGGFSYGDDFAAGRILAAELNTRFKDKVRGFIGEGKLIIGICNGFQVLVKAGFLPGNADFAPEATLMLNDSGKFESRWVYLKSGVGSQEPGDGTVAGKCVWARALPEVIYLPVAHGEGKFQVRDAGVLKRIKDNGQVVFKYFAPHSGHEINYPYNPNGSLDNIAGICDDTGRILGLMPHPERNISGEHDPRWTYLPLRKSYGDGLQIFKNGVNYARSNL